MTEFLNDTQLQLLEFVKQQHGDQVRKYTNTPYWEHPVAVANRVKHIKYAVEIALCHDLFEDTPCNFEQLFNRMVLIGYGRDFAYDVCRGVQALTDVYTQEAHPYLNRMKRKEAEAKRLGKTSGLIQTIKYADLMDNTTSIVEHDIGFARKYLAEKRVLLDEMRAGDIDLLIECCWTLKNAQDKINEK